MSTSWAANRVDCIHDLLHCHCCETRRNEAKRNDTEGFCQLPWRQSSTSTQTLLETHLWQVWVLHPSCNSAEKIKAYSSLRQLKATVDSTVHWTLQILDCRLLKNLAAMTPILKQLQTALFAAALISITALNAAEKMGLPCRRSQMSQQCEGSHWEFLPASIRFKK